MRQAAVDFQRTWYVIVPFKMVVTDRPVLPWPYRGVLRGGMTVLEGAGILARGTGSCT